MTNKAGSINEVVKAIENTASMAEAADTLSSENSSAIAALGAVHTLASNIPGTGAPGAVFLGSVGQAISFASVASAASDGEFTFTDKGRWVCEMFAC